MANQWFKFYGSEYLSDPKIATLSAQERSCWVTLMALASTASTPGYVEYLTTEVLLTKSGIIFDPYNPEEWDRCLGVLDKFVRLKMISKDDSGNIVITNWSKRQETNLTDAERAKSYRDRMKNRHANVTLPVTNVTQEENRIEENREDIYIASDSEKPIKVRKDLGGFQQFRDLYPKKEDLASASAVWREMSAKERSSALEDIPKRLKSPRWLEEGGKYIPLAKNYLKGRRWEDELPTNKSNVYVV